MEPQLKTFDQRLALEQAGGSAELANELFTMLLRELPQFERGIRSAHQRNDLDTLQRTVHKLNGAATYCGVPALKHAADYLETALKREQFDRVEPGLAALLDAIHQVQERAHERTG